MAKSVYKIPADLDASYLDMEIAIRSNDGIGVKPLPMKIVFTYLISFLVCFWAVMNSFISRGTVLQKILFVILWIAFTFLLGKYDATHRMQGALVPTLLNYMPTLSRRVVTRSNSNAIPFYSIVGIKKDGIDKRTGMISFEDGTYGYMYRVVGSASVLLFDSDRNAILDRVDAFYRKLGTESEQIFITTKSSQAVYKQVASLKKTYDNLVVKDPDLVMLANEQFGILKNYVGGSFKAIHQYLIIKADNKEMLLQTKSVLQSELENSTMMIKRCVPLYYEDITHVFGLIFKGKDGSKA